MFLWRYREIRLLTTRLMLSKSKRDLQLTSDADIMKCFARFVQSFKGLIRIKISAPADNQKLTFFDTLAD